MAEQYFSIDDIVDRLRRRAEGDAAALDDVWAPESVSWRSYNQQESIMSAAQRAALARREVESFGSAMPDFSRESTFHPSPSTQTVVEFSTWSGSRDGVAVRVELCLSYAVATGRIDRVDMYADPTQLAALSAVLASAEQDNAAAISNERQDGSAEHR